MGRSDRILTRRRAPQYGWTPLYIAADKGHLAVVELLVAKRADMNAPDMVKGGRGEDVERTQSACVSCWGLEQG